MHVCMEKILFLFEIKTKLLLFRILLFCFFENIIKLNFKLSKRFHNQYHNTTDIRADAN